MGKKKSWHFTEFQREATFAAIILQAPNVSSLTLLLPFIDAGSSASWCEQICLSCILTTNCGSSLFSVHSDVSLLRKKTDSGVSWLRLNRMRLNYFGFVLCVCVCLCYQKKKSPLELWILVPFWLVLSNQKYFLALSNEL